jgi:hypothetical protein
MCASGAEPRTATVQSPELIEISGLAASRKQEGVLWAHNDSGDAARVFAMGLDGRELGTFDLQGTEAIDWEDMALGPGPDPDLDYLYLGDIGDNAAQRPEIVVYRMPEPVVDAAGEVPPTFGLGERIVLRYPDRPHDAETLFSDPETGDLLILTKELTGGPAFLFRAAADAISAADAVVTLEAAGQVDFQALRSAVRIPEGSPPLPSGLGHLPTGGDIAADASAVAVRTYSTVWVWERREGQSIAQALAGTPCEAPSQLEPQGEAIALLPDGSGYVTASEGVNPPLYRFGGE